MPKTRRAGFAVGFPFVRLLPGLCAGFLLAGCNATPDALGTGLGGAGGSGAGGSGAGDPAATGGSPVVVLGSRDASADRPASDCGNGVLDGGEQCDDGNTQNGDGCSRICQIEDNHTCPTAGAPCVNLAICGNGVLTSDETCDDGNTKDGDGCAADCQAVEPGWRCRVPGKRCTPACGDGLRGDREACDDGNTTSGDGCSAQCQIEVGFRCDGQPSACARTRCGDGQPEGTEACDDGNLLPFDGCSATCQAEPACRAGACTSTCGDGIVLNEACDDGNLADGDGCSRDCALEPGWTCRQPPLGETMAVPVIYRDFKRGHPTDFEPDDEVGCPAGKCVGMVEGALDGEGKPVFTGVTDQGVDVAGTDTFRQWYRDTPGVNHANPGTLVLWERGGGAYVNRYGANGEPWKPGVDGNPLFFPVDGDPFSAGELAPAQIPGFYDPVVPYDVDAAGNRRQHNFSFTSEVRYWFKYDPAQTYQLEFLGDDDFWVFINGRLALDLGGLHSATPGAVTLDAATAAKLGGLQAGNVYEVAVFHAERHTTASSFKLTLSGFNPAATRCEPRCGDGVAVADEECDQGDQNSDTAYGGCTTTCRWGAFCGDGVVNGPEECDAGKNNGRQYGADGCTFGCTRAHFCGDGHVDTNRDEECDLADKNGVALGRDGAPSTEPGAQIYCTPACKIPPLVF